jgi:uncharacterized protein YndB with AHSA1/START domain
MAVYRFLTTWVFDAPREPVWDLVYDGAGWPAWWRGVKRAEVLRPGDETGTDARPVFAWNHHRIMHWGAEGAAHRLGCGLVAAS